MSLVKLKDKRTGVTYVYESESYWDKEKKQPRNKRTLIGRIDDITGEIVPTNGRGRKRKTIAEEETVNSDILSDYKKQLKEKDEIIKQLTEDNKKLENDLFEVLKQLRMITERYKEN